MGPPPRLVRRLVLAPVVLLLALLVATSMPLLAVVAAGASPFLPGRWRPLRLLWFALVFLFVESLGLLACFGLWVASGFGWKLDHPRIQGGHETLIRWYLGVIVSEARRTFRMRIEVEGWDGQRVTLRERNTAQDLDTTGPPETRRPLLVLSRHAGAGDSFLLVYALTRLRRHPRVVLKAALQWAPCLDVVLHRIPAEFVVPGASREDAIEGIARLAAGLGPSDGMVLFPEGGNFTEGRRTRSIAKLEELGLHDEAEQARAMRYVLAPRPTGVIAALDANPDLDVVFVAHTGLEDLSGIVDLWRGLPMDSAIEVKLWRVRAADVPTDPDERAAWLFSWWRTIDAWILDKRGEVAVPDAIVAELLDDA
jgi:1-acyl-sn-glycerol-3-phosphate acyltransferase